MTQLKCLSITKSNILENRFIEEVINNLKRFVVDKVINTFTSMNNNQISFIKL